jgi:Fe(3+) dicitrate transport protein
MRLKNSIRKLHSFETGKAKHDIDFGIRYHEDYEDRFQWIDGYAIQNG